MTQLASIEKTIMHNKLTQNNRISLKSLLGKTNMNKSNKTTQLKQKTHFQLNYC